MKDKDQGRKGGMEENEVEEKGEKGMEEKKEEEGMEEKRKK